MLNPLVGTVDLGDSSAAILAPPSAKAVRFADWPKCIEYRECPRSSSLRHERGITLTLGTADLVARLIDSTSHVMYRLMAVMPKKILGDGDFRAALA